MHHLTPDDRWSSTDDRQPTTNATNEWQQTTTDNKRRPTINDDLPQTTNDERRRSKTELFISSLYLFVTSTDDDRRRSMTDLFISSLYLFVTSISSWSDFNSCPLRSRNLVTYLCKVLVQKMTEVRTSLEHHFCFCRASDWWIEKYCEVSYLKQEEEK